MKTVVYCNPFVPAEWIEAHGLRARWIAPQHTVRSAEPGAVRGMCPYAQAVVDSLSRMDATSLAVMTTTCDQMRHGAELVAKERPDRVFLLNVPSTWQSPASRAYYAAELKRLGRWLIDRDATPPTPERLARAMRDNDTAREAFRRGEIPAENPSWCNPVTVDLARQTRTTRSDDVAIGLIGSPLLPHDLAMVQAVTEAGGRIAFDGTCGGPRTLPDRFDPTSLAHDPFNEMVRAYFDCIPAIFQRPADRLHAWITGALNEYRPQALLCLRRVWCDLWHAALPRLRQSSGVPVLDLDLGDEQQGGAQRLASRIEAVLESLRDKGVSRNKGVRTVFSSKRKDTECRRFRQNSSDPFIEDG